MKQDIKINEHYDTEASQKDLLHAISDTSKATADLAMQNSTKIIQLSRTVTTLTTCLIGSVILLTFTLILNYIL